MSLRLARPELAAWAASDEYEDLAALMSEDSVGENHGRKATDRRPTTQPDKDGEQWGASHRSLCSGDHATRQFVAQGGAEVVSEDWGHFHGLVTHWGAADSHRTLSSKELDALDTEAVRAAALAGLGFTEDDMAVLDGPGGATPAKAALRARFDARLLEVQESGGRMTDLARALGWNVVGAGVCYRMHKALKRARRAREQAARPPEVVIPEGARPPGSKCLCGCDRETPLASKTRNGNVKGHPLRYIPGHNSYTGPAPVAA